MPAKKSENLIIFIGELSGNCWEIIGNYRKLLENYRRMSENYRRIIGELSENIGKLSENYRRINLRARVMATFVRLCSLRNPTRPKKEKKIIFFRDSPTFRSRNLNQNYSIAGKKKSDIIAHFFRAFEFFACFNFCLVV